MQYMYIPIINVLAIFNDFMNTVKLSSLSANAGLYFYCKNVNYTYVYGLGSLDISKQTDFEELIIDR